MLMSNTTKPVSSNEKPVSFPTTDNYIQHLIDRHLPSAPIACDHHSSDHRVKTIHAIRSCHPTELLWRELPYAALQHESNKRHITCCANCFTPLIQLETEWSRVHQLAQMNSSSNQNQIASLQDLRNTISYFSMHQNKSFSPIGVESSAVGRLHDACEVFSLAESAVKCPSCEDEIYCSIECQQDAFWDSHGLLCAGSKQHTSAIAHFLAFAKETNELFVLAAKILAKILIGYIKTSNLPNARAVIDQFNMPPWWSVVAYVREDQYGKSEEAFRENLQRMLHQAFEYLMAGLMENVAKFLDSIGSSNAALTVESVMTVCRECLNVELYAKLVGLFVVKNVRMEIDHPFQTLQISLMDLQNEQPISSALEESISRVQQTLSIVLSDTNAESSDSDSDSMDTFIPSVKGSAFLPIICTMNHNIAPNCTVLFTRSGQANVFVIKTVKQGDELSVQYNEMDSDSL
uniref:Uncharacterized protein AlNc14C101G6037 n=1 Tax=Albugo laibachii Nc14 TaxID=890382 RepID=F0WHH4_9STRA|nr:conserved hypothetical protein [Albugo laibachii Nc14]|eukprot:CCA20693.1 conserved hypothetical protein [Albugo laibachii Nc14]